MQQRRGEPTVEMPHETAAEKALLGAAVLEAAALDLLVERGVQPPWFYEGVHAKVWEVLQREKESGRILDLTLLASRLEAEGIDGATAVQTVAGLGEAAVPVSLVPHYLEIVEERYKQRQLIHLGYRLRAAVLEPNSTSDQVIDGAVREMEALREVGLRELERPVVQVLGTVLEKMEHYERLKTQGGGLQVGIGGWDKFLSGLGEGCGYYHVLSGRPGGGKSSLALQVALHASIRQQQPVLLVSIEMNGESCVQRMLFMEAQADIQRWRTGYGRVNANNEFERLMQASERLAAAKLLIDDTGSMTCEELIARVKRVHRQQKLGLVILDYVQLLRSGRRTYRSDRVQELTEISGEIRRCANRLKLPWLVLAQMNRDIEREVSRPPRLSDLKDSGALEQDADTVTFVYRPHVNSESKQAEVEETIARWCAEQEKSGGGVVWAKPEYSHLLVAKNRYGPIGRVEVLFVKACTYFEDYQEVRARLGLKPTGRRRQPAATELVLDGDDERG